MKVDLEKKTVTLESGDVDGGISSNETSVKDAVTKNKERLLEILLKETPWAVERYKAQIKPNGGLLTASMGFAYEKGLRDAIKILAKEGQI